MAFTQSKPWSRLAQFALRTIIFFSIAFATLWTVLSFWPGLAILPFVGRAKISPFCSTWQAVRDAAVKVRQGELEKEIRANTRLIRTEKGYKLWSTPKGEFWVPDTSDQIIAIQLAQQKRKIYGDAESGGVRAGDIVLDGANDAALLRDPRVRNGVARAALHAVIKYMNQFDTNDPVPLVFLPEPPANVRAIGKTNGIVSLAWAVPVSVANSGVPTNYVVYQSTNGYGFGNAISVGNVTNCTITNLTAGADCYFRVAAANAGGESFPSAVVGCRPPLFSTSKKILFVNAFDRFDRTTDLKQNFTAQNYVPPGGSGGNDRVLPRRINSFDYVVPHGRAISAAGVAFDSCQHLAITNDLVALTNYPIVIWACGNESTADESYSSAEQTKVAAFLAGGGNLFTSGAEIAWDLDRPSGPTTADRNFIHNQLHAAYVADSSGVWNFTAVTNSIFAGNTNGAFDDGSKGIYLVGYPDLIAPTNGAAMSVNYSNVTGGAAGILYNGTAGGGKVVYLGFPFETILSA